jgi:hypothetical protein
LRRQPELGSYLTAWYLCHRIRHAVPQEPLAGLLGAGGRTVEVDETYVGGKPLKGHSGAPAKRGRGTKKVPVVALLAPNGPCAGQADHARRR